MKRGNSTITLYSLFELFYGSRHIFNEERNFHRKPIERKVLLKEHFKSIKHELELDSDYCTDAVIRAYLCMESGRSRGGAVKKRKNVSHLLSNDYPHTWEKIVEDNRLLLMERLSPDRFKVFREGVSIFFNQARDNDGDKDTFEDSVLEGIYSVIIDALYSNPSSQEDTYYDFAKVISILFIMAFLQDRTKEVSFLFSGRTPLRPGFFDTLTSLNRNIRLMFKEEAEDPIYFPFFEKMYNIRYLTLVNFAGTSFISCSDISDFYSINDPYKRWFIRELTSGRLKADIVLTNPFSDAAKDAARKMKGDGIKAKKTADSIILYNIKLLLDFKRRNPNASLSLRLTDISLPFGALYAESMQYNYSWIKIDIYSALLKSDIRRPSFYLYRGDSNTAHLFESFYNNIGDIKKSAIEINQTINFDWIRGNKPFVHRAVISPDYKKLEHSIISILACVSSDTPMQLDLLFLKNGEIIIGNDVIIKSSQSGIPFSLSSCTIDKLRRMRNSDYTLLNGENLNFVISQLPTLKEALGLIAGRVPVILEAKVLHDEPIDEIRTKAERLVGIVRYYNNGNAYAIQSNNPYFIAAIKDLLVIIPVGQVIRDINGANDIIDEYQHLHKDFASTKVAPMTSPDFFTCDINNINILKNALIFSRTRKIPIISGIICNEEQELNEVVRECDNIIIKGALTFSS